MKFVNEPSQEELKTIQNMIYENKSFSEMGETINRNYKTVKRIVDVYKLDMSKYNATKAKGKRNKKALSNGEIGNIVSLLENGVSLKSIVSNMNVSLPTLSRNLRENGINPESYRRKSEKKFELTKEQQEIVKTELEKETITSLAKKYNIGRNTFSSYLRENGLLDITNKSISNDLKELILDSHKKYITISTISIITGLNKDTIKAIIKTSDTDITERDKYKYKSLHLDEVLDSILQLLSSFNAEESTSIITKEDIDYYLDNINKVCYLNIMRALNKDGGEFKKVLRIINKEDTVAYNNLVTYEYSDEFIKEFSVTANSSVYISAKYGMSVTAVSTTRKKVYGEDFKTCYRSNYSKSKLELSFEDLMYTLDIAFIPEYNLEGHKYDYYLGHKILIELDGSHWHKEDRALKNDNSKDLIAKEKEYKLIRISEEDLQARKNDIAKEVLDIYLQQIQNQYFK